MISLLWVLIIKHLPRSGRQKQWQRPAGPRRCRRNSNQSECWLETALPAVGLSICSATDQPCNLQPSGALPRPCQSLVQTDRRHTRGRMAVHLWLYLVPTLLGFRGLPGRSNPQRAQAHNRSMATRSLCFEFPALPQPLADLYFMVLGIPRPLYRGTYKHKCNYCTGAAQKRLVWGFMSLLGRGK